MPRIVRASVLDAYELAGNLREPDKAELAAHNKTPLTGLIESVEASGDAAWLIEHRGEPLALFGAADCTNGRGAPWLLGSDALITTHKRWFLNNSRRIIETPDIHFTTYYNLVDARNRVHVRWLKWVGFLVLDPIPWGPHRLPFHPFYRKVQTNV